MCRLRETGVSKIAFERSQQVPNLDTGVLCAPAALAAGWPTDQTGNWVGCRTTLDMVARPIVVVTRLFSTHKYSIKHEHSTLLNTWFLKIQHVSKGLHNQGRVNMLDV